MALNTLYRVTDTGGGSSGDNNRSLVAKTTTPKTTTATTSAAKTASTSKKTTAAKTVSSNVNNSYKPSTYKRSYTPYTRRSYPTYPSTPSAPAAKGDDNFSKNWNAWITNMNNAYNSAATQMASSADEYKNGANQNLAGAENRWNTTYNNINTMLSNLATENQKREQATIDAINNAYDAVIGNANEYYQNLLDTYDRSMGYVDQGYNESIDVADQARNEAMQIAQQLYEMGEAQQNRDTERALKAQYASYMKGIKNMNQFLAAQGINGGASETAYLNALNGYEGNRTDLNEAKLSALGLLRQQQMQSDSEAQQAYLNKISEFIQNRTGQQLQVENNRSQGEYNFANMKNEAESNKGNQLVTSQNNFQNWSSDLVGKKSSNETSYADAIRQLADSRNTVLYNGVNLANQAAQLQVERELAEAQAVAALSEKDKKAKKTQKKAKSSSKKKSKKKKK